MLISQVLLDWNPWWRGLPVPGLKPKRRLLQPILTAQLLKVSDRRASVVVGPRQVGKTAILRQCVHDILKQGWPPANVLYCDFSDDRFSSHVPSLRQVAEYEPEGLRPDLPRVFLFDEIGRDEAWADWLKFAVDNTSHRILATDSAATLLRRGSQESGYGRWDEYLLEGLTFEEFLLLQGLPNETAAGVAERLPAPLERFLQSGGFPEHIFNEDAKEVRERIRSDVVSKAISRDLARYDVDVRLRDLFVYLVENSGAIFKPASSISDLQRSYLPHADKRSLGKWLEILQQALLIRALDPVSSRPIKRLSGKSRPKLYAADHGLIVAFSTLPDPMADGATRGQAFEAAVFRQLRASVARESGKLNYFRASAGGKDYEVDFVIQAGAGLLAIEVTSQQRPEKKLHTLKAAAAMCGAKRMLVVFDGFTESEVEGVGIVPLQTFLLNPARYLEGNHVQSI